MKLEVGKRYLTRNGLVVGPIVLGEDGNYALNRKGGLWYSSGRIIFGGAEGESPADLIAEYHGTPSAAPAAPAAPAVFVDVSSLKEGDTVLVRGIVDGQGYGDYADRVKIYFGTAKSGIWVTRDLISSVEPRALAVGDRVKWCEGLIRTLIGIDGQYAWIKSDNDGFCGSVLLSDLTRA